MRIEIISEGSIDFVLLCPLLQSIAGAAGAHWPLTPSDYTETRLRKRGFGAVALAVDAIIQDGQYLDDQPDFYVIVLDQRNLEPIIREVRRKILHIPKMIFGVAIEEIEAWWLGDRNQTLGWLHLTNEAASDVGYSHDYWPESDPEPKKMLGKLIEISDQTFFNYGDGSQILAAEFVEAAWSHHVNLEALAERCPNGFRPFLDDVSGRFQR